MAKTITIKLHYSSREEQQELIDYLENKCWDFEVEDFGIKELRREMKLAKESGVSSWIDNVARKIDAYHGESN